MSWLNKEAQKHSIHRCCRRGVPFRNVTDELTRPLNRAKFVTSWTNHSVIVPYSKSGQFPYSGSTPRHAKMASENAASVRGGSSGGLGGKRRRRRTRREAREAAKAKEAKILPFSPTYRSTRKRAVLVDFVADVWTREGNICSPDDQHLRSK